MFGTDYFQIIHGEVVMTGELAPSALVAETTAAPMSGLNSHFERGTLMDRNGVAEVSILGQGNYVGFLSKKITYSGPDFQAMTLGDPDLPAKSGQKVSLAVVADGGEIEAEGEANITATTETLGRLVTSSTGAITSSTALDTDLSCINGLWRVAQTGDRILGRLKAQLTVVVSGSACRILIELVRGGIKK